MPLTAANVITRAQDLVQDQTSVRWPEAEMLRWLNDARREISIVRPDLYATTTTVALSAGSRQAVPADGTRFLDAVRNVTAGNVIGKAVRLVQREVLDAQRPAWHTEAEVTDIRHFMFDERSPRTFYVYPPAQAGHKLDIVYSQTPTEISSTDTVLTQEDVYSGAIVDYLCYRAFSKDAQYAGNAARAAAHYAQFTAALGIGVRGNMVVSPNTARIDGMPPRTAAAMSQG